MAKSVVINLSINEKDGVKSLGSLNNEVKSTLTNMNQLEDASSLLNEELKKVDFGTAEYEKLRQELIKVNSEIKNQELALEALDPEQKASEFGSFAGGMVSMATAAAGLSNALGITDESSLEMIETLSTGMAIAEGFRGGIEGIISFQKLLRNSTIAQNAILTINNLLKGTNTAVTATNTAATIAQTGATVAQTTATGSATVAQGLLNAVMSANPIGLIVVAIGALVAAFIFFGDTILDIIKVVFAPFIQGFNLIKGALSSLGIIQSEEAKKIKQIEQDKYDKLKELNKQKIALIDAEIEANKRLTDEVTASIDFEIRKRQAAGEDTANLERNKLVILAESTKKELELTEMRNASKVKELQHYVELGGFISDMATNRLKEIEEEKAVLAKTLEGLNQDIIVFDIEQTKSQNDEEKKRNDNSKKNIKDKIDYQALAEKKQKENHSKFLDELEALDEENYQLTLTDQQKEEKAVEDKYFRLIELAKQYGEDVTKLEEDQKSKLEAIDADYKAKQKAENDKLLKEIKDAEDKALQEKLDNDKKALEAQKLANEELLTSMQNTASAFSDVVSAALSGGFDSINASFAALNDSLFNEETGLFTKMKNGSVSAVEAVAIAVETTMQIMSTVLSAQEENAATKREETYSREADALKSSLNNREISQKQYEEKVALMNQRKEQAELTAKRKAFKQQKGMAIVNAVMSTAQAVIQGMANMFPLNIIMSALAAGVGAAQIGIISSQSFKAARGGVVPGTGPSNRDSVNALLAPGEMVINAQSAGMFPDTLSQINQAGGGISLAPERAAVQTQQTEVIYKENDKQSTIKAYVVETDITDKQKKVDRMRQSASFN